jgi:beta-lactamase regulating signal transducer with metallopeptidase domain
MKSTITDFVLSLSRWAELAILGKTTVIVTLGLIAVRVTSRARASVRHLLLATTFATMLAFPLVFTTAPALTIDIPVAQQGDSVARQTATLSTDTAVNAANNSSAAQVANRSAWSAPSWSTILRSLWIAGTFLLILSLAVDLFRLRGLRRNGIPWTELNNLTRTLATESGVRRPVEILLHEDLRAPLTCGAWHPVIMLPLEARQWDEADLHRALVHELEHVRRGDWATQLVARAVCAGYWFNPLVWVAWRRLCLEAERACDDAVVQGAENADYAEQLVTLSQRLSNTQPLTILGMANRSDLSKRISAILDSSQQRGPAGLLAAAGAIVIAGFVLIGIAPLRVVAQVTNQDTARKATASRNEAKSPFDRVLVEAAEEGNASDIIKVLDAGANVNCVVDGDGSPLIVAARNGHQAVVQLLLDRGADPNLAVPGDGNPLIMAAREGHTQIVQLLLDRGSNIDQVVPGDENALIQASGEGQLEVAKLLVGKGADVNARVLVERDGPSSTSELRTPLSMARKNGHREVVDFLVASGARE